MINKPVFEADVCSRCAGSGSYSYNQMDGDRCFGCRGSGWRLTKRGAAAQKWFEDQARVPASEIKAGDTIRVDGISASYFDLVIDVSIGPAKTLGSYSVGYEDRVEVLIHTKRGCGLRCLLDSTVRKGMGVYEKRALINEALTYQNSLTKAGTPRKTTAPAAQPKEI